MASNNYEVIIDGGKPIKAWVKHDNVTIEDSAMEQLVNVSRLPIIHSHVAVMPDVHWGYGATVGSVIPTVGAVIPAAVGVDIGCGMRYARTSLMASDMPDNLAGLRAAIEAGVPHGRTDEKELRKGARDKGSWGDIPERVAREFRKQNMQEGFDRILDSYPKLAGGRGGRNGWTVERAIRHLGTLGTGNHFIEITLDEEDRVGIMLHTGSRGFGNAVGREAIDTAKREAEFSGIAEYLPSKDLAWFYEKGEGERNFQNYVHAVQWGQDFAAMNRRVMMEAVVEAMMMYLKRPFDAKTMAVECHHNYVTRENHFGQNVWVTRKGAVNAREGVMGIIPGSMGARSYIVRGLGNRDSFCSCSHGAGRLMSRGKANKTITLEDHIKATEGIECRKDAEVLDESPAAYKPIDAVMEAQRDLVEVVHEVRQIVNVKG